MPKPLPPRTVAALSPPANAHWPYTFFEAAAAHPFDPRDTRLNLRNAWFLADSAFLAYSNEEQIRRAFGDAGMNVRIAPFAKGSTQCYVAAADDWIVLAIRGTQVDDFWQVVADWATNVRFLPVAESGHLVHAGFRDALELVWSDVSAAIRREQRLARRPLWVTGHSLGGAIATIAALRCVTDPELGLTGACTFGSPRVGSRGFGSAITAPVFRFRHNADVVTHVPLGLLFRHVGALQFIDAGGVFHPGRGAMTEMWLDARALVGRLTRPARPIERAPGLPRPLADHAPINYAILVWNALEAAGGVAETV